RQLGSAMNQPRITHARWILAPMKERQNDRVPLQTFCFVAGHELDRVALGRARLAQGVEILPQRLSKLTQRLSIGFGARRKREQIVELRRIIIEELARNCCEPCA